MSLNIKTHQAEIAKLSEALGNVSDRQNTLQSQVYFINQATNSKALKIALDSPAENAEKIRSFSDSLSGICEALADHTTDPAGRLFWQNQATLLLGLADHFQALISDHQKQLLTH